MSAWAILAAAGSGERLGADRPKAFVALGELPLLATSMERLDESDWIDSIVVAAPLGWDEPSILLAEEIGAGKVASVVPGGETRAASVSTALAEVPEDAAVVLVHDAARPLLADEVLERVLAPLSEGWDGVVPGLRIADTVKRVSGDEVVETLDREGLIATQTPQAFVTETLRLAFGPSSDLAQAGGGGGATDCAALVEARGGRVKVVPGDPRLLKVTTPEDLELVESWL
jgi:2-C-methyl-D-erythritol 4-phosphate cytidylyltransferase